MASAGEGANRSQQGKVAGALRKKGKSEKGLGEGGKIEKKNEAKAKNKRRHR